MSALGTQRIQRVSLHYPRWGSARADVRTEAGSVTPGPATLTVGDLPLVGHVPAPEQGLDAPDDWHGIWTNGAGWDVVPGARSYQSDAGVKLSTVLADLAKDCAAAFGYQVPILQPTDATIGTAWARPATHPDGQPYRGRDALAALVLGDYVPGPWWVDPAGVTRFGGRATGTVAALPGTVRVRRRNLAVGLRVLGCDSPAAFVPGLTFEGDIIGRVVVNEDAGALTLETWRR